MSESTSTASPAMSRTTVIFWVLNISLPLLVLLIPTGERFTPEIRLFLAITLAAILLFAFETLPSLIPAILLPVTYTLSGIAPALAVFGPWSTYVPWMFLSGILMANVLENIGLLRRIALWSIIKAGGTYRGILYGIMVAGIIINIFIPAQAIIPLAAFTFGICMALDLGKSPESAGIMLTGAFAALLPLFFFYNPNFAVIMGAASAEHDVSITWIQYFLHNLPNIPWAFFCVFLVSIIFKPSRPMNVKAYMMGEYAKLGALSWREKKALLVIALLVAFLVSGGWHGINIGWGFVFAASMMYLPGINLGTEADIKKINFPLIFFVTACMAIGGVANVLGLGKLLAEVLLPHMESASLFSTIGMVWLLCVAANFLMTPLAIWAAFSAPLTAVAQSLGIDPMAFYYTIFQGTDQIIFPYEYVLYLIFFSFGLIGLRDFMKIFALKMVLNIVFLIAVLVPYWMLIGLL